MRLSQPQLAVALEALYASHNRRALVDPDPLQCVYRYSDAVDREIAGLIAAGLAYGRVVQIMRNVNVALDQLGPSPRAWLEDSSPRMIVAVFKNFQHRWTTGAEVSAVLLGIRRMIIEHGSLENAFLHHQKPADASTIPALIGFCSELRNGTKNSLLPDPAKSAACKRLHLYLRWMVRSDEVDLGCWSTVSPAHLIVPLDTHMHQIARRLGMTRRNQANLQTALEITRGFRRINPADPTRYDFVLTRFGIRPELSLAQLDTRLRNA